MPLDPRVRLALALQRLGGADDDATLPARRLAGTLQARRFGRLVMRPGPPATTCERMVPVAGGAVRVRLYRPADAAVAGGRLSASTITPTTLPGDVPTDGEGSPPAAGHRAVGAGAAAVAPTGAATGRRVRA